MSARRSQPAVPPTAASPRLGCATSASASGRTSSSSSCRSTCRSSPTRRPPCRTWSQRVRSRCAADPRRWSASDNAREEHGQVHAEARRRWQEEARKDWDASPIATARLATEIWDAIKGTDWVLTANALSDWALAPLGLRGAGALRRQQSRHGDADRHLARRGSRLQGHGQARRRYSAGRRPDVRRRARYGRPPR